MSDYFAGDHKPPELETLPPAKGKARRIKLPDHLGMGFSFVWPIYSVVVACTLVFLWQTLPWFIGFFLNAQVPSLSLYDYAFSAEAMKEGRYWTIFTSLFFHGGLLHIGFNMSAYLSLAPMVYRRFGKSLGGFVGFLAFYLLTGLAGNLVFWGLHPTSDVPLVGASGAIFGLFGGMIRLNPFSDKPEGLFSRAVLRGWWYFFLSNLIVVVVAGGPAVLLQIAAGQPAQNLFIPIAWEAHLGGFVAGLLLIPIMAGKGWDEVWKTGIIARMEALQSLEAKGA